MPGPRRSPPGEATITIRGQRVPYMERCRVRRRDYYLLHPVGSPHRQRFRAFDPFAGPGGDFFQVQFWSDDPAAVRNLRLLRRFKDDAFPRVVELERHAVGHAVALTWVEGISLAEYFDHLRQGRRPAVDPGQAVRLVRGLANGVCHLHKELRICHGDIQPANVVLTSHPSRLTLIDFGSAWTYESAVGRDKGDGVHPSYSAPEVLASHCVSGFHADQFSVSVLFYELLTRQLPYQGLGGQAGLPPWSKSAAQALVPPSALTPVGDSLPRQLKQHLDEVVLRGLALTPEKRFPDRHAWLDALFELHTRFRLPSKPAGDDHWLTRLVAWCAGEPRSRRNHEGEQ